MLEEEFSSYFSDHFFLSQATTFRLGNLELSFYVTIFPLMSRQPPVKALSCRRGAAESGYLNLILIRDVFPIQDGSSNEIEGKIKGHI